MRKVVQLGLAESSSKEKLGVNQGFSAKTHWWQRKSSSSGASSADTLRPRHIEGQALEINGLRCLYTPTGSYSEIELDIVAVHGLGGGARRTWTSETTDYFWLEELPKTFEPANIKARIFTFGYDSTTIGGKSVATVSDIASGLLAALRRGRLKAEEINRPLIFICHSLGGIIVKKALSMAGLNQTFKELRHAVYGVAFMATPHRGSSVADIAGIIGTIIQFATVGLVIPTNLLESLKTEAETLKDLSESFRHQRIRILTFYETKAMVGQSSPIVNRDSAVLNSPEELQIPCNANHREICKFPSPEDCRFQEVVGELQIMAKEATSHCHINISNLRENEQEFLRNLNKKHDLHSTTQLEEQLDKRCPNTVTWIQNDQSFLKWMDQSAHSRLWIHGGPGCGKTVTAASIVEKLQNDLIAPGSSSSPLIIYYFVDGKETGKSSHLNIFPGLISQILQQRPELIVIARQLSNTDEDHSSTPEKYIKIIRRIVRNISKVFLVVDAIDELEVLDTRLPTMKIDKQKANILKQLFELDRCTPCLKFLVTSRTYPGPAIEPIFGEYKPVCISLMAMDQVNYDIETYMDYELAEFHSVKCENDRRGVREKRIKERIKSTIVRDAGGMFLYAYLAWTTFRDWQDDWDDKGLENRFRKLAILAADAKGTNTTGQMSVAGITPHVNITLYSFYLNILNMLPAAGTDRQQLNARNLFRWLVTAHTPLKIAELRDVYALESSKNSTSKDNRGFVMTEEAFAKIVKDHCGSLVQIRPASRTVHLYHQSIKEFFLETDHPLSFKRAEAETRCSVICLKYINSVDFTPSGALPATGAKDETYEADFQLIHDYPFLKYAIVHWPHHTQQALDSAELWNLFVSWANSSNLNICCRIFWHYEGKDEFPQNTKPMHILCFLGLEQLIRRAFREKDLLQWDLVDTTDSLGRSPLHWAALNGHDVVVQLLLIEGADPQLKDLKAWTPLDLAMDCGKESVVRLLLGGNKFEGQSGSWLEMAAIGGHTDLVRFLLDHIIDVNASLPLSNYGSALHAAAYHGHLAIVALMLEKGVNPDLWVETYGTALQAAAFEDHQEIVELLLSKKVNPNSTAGIYGTALQSAAHRGFTNIVILLIKSGANVNTQGDHFGTARYAADIAGNDDTEKVLAAAGGISEPPSIEPRQSDMQASERHALDLLRQEASKGRLLGVKKRVETVKKHLITAIRTQNKRQLKWGLKIGVYAFKEAISLGNEEFLAFLVNVGMVVALAAVAAGHPDALRTILVYWTKALVAAIDQHKASLVQRTVKVCVEDFRDLVAGGKHEKAKDLFIVGWEMYLQICRAENEHLIQMVAKVWVEGTEELMKGEFGEKVKGVMREYTKSWVEAVREGNQAEVRAMGKAHFEYLIAAAGGRQKDFLGEFMLILTERLTNFQIKSPETKQLLDTSRSFTSAVAYGKQDEERVESAVRVGMEYFIVLVEKQALEVDYLRDALADIIVVALKEIHKAGLLGSIKEVIVDLVDEKFGVPKVNNTQSRYHLNDLEAQTLGFLDLVIAKVKNESSELLTTAEGFKRAITACTTEARARPPPPIRCK